MQSKTKKVADIQPGDVVVRSLEVRSVTTTADGWTLTYADGCTERFDRATDPAITVAVP